MMEITFLNVVQDMGSTAEQFLDLHMTGLGLEV
jgi:hypothetical protein